MSNFIMIDGPGAFATAAELQKFLDAARKLEQTEEVKREIARAEMLLKTHDGHEHDIGARR